MALYTIANQAGALVRAALNTVLGKLQRNYFGTVDPASVGESTPGMWWINTNGATPIVTVRNTADTAWITAFEIEAGATDWLGKVTSSNATLTGGTINGMTIGASTPAAATFTAATADRVTVSSDTSADVLLFDTLVASTHSGTRLSRDGNSLLMQTRTSANGLVSTDMAATVGASGVSAWSFRVTGTERLAVTSSGVAVSGAINVSNGGNFSTGDLTFEANVDLIPTDVSPNNRLGTPTQRWNFIYLNNAPVVISDARLKSDIADLTDAERRAAAKIKTRTFTMAATGQKKVGYIAQEVIEAMASEGLDAVEYGLVTPGEIHGVDYDAVNAFRLG